jgi:hypothetical protein
MVSDPGLEMPVVARPRLGSDEKRAELPWWLDMAVSCQVVKAERGRKAWVADLGKTESRKRQSPAGEAGDAGGG